MRFFFGKKIKNDKRLFNTSLSPLFLLFFLLISKSTHRTLNHRYTRTTQAFAEVEKLKNYLAFDSDTSVEELFGSVKLFMEDYLSSLKDRDTRRRILQEKIRREQMQKTIREKRGTRRASKREASRDKQ